MLADDSGRELYGAIVGMVGLIMVSFVYASYRPRGRRLLGYLVIALGVLLLLALGRYQLRLALLGVRTAGVVVAVEPSRKAYRPVVRFVSAAGEEVVFRGASISDRTSYAPGQPVTVRYLPANPSFAEVDSWLSLWRPLLIGAVFDGIVVGGGILIVRRHPKVRGPPA